MFTDLYFSGASISGFSDPTGYKLEIIGPQCGLSDDSRQIRHTVKLRKKSLRLKTCVFCVIPNSR